MHATEALAEADRLMTICNSCRYCEGLCAVFPALQLRRAFSDGDLDYLANLCHGCGACYYDCQYAPPHEFTVNVPLALSAVRGESYVRHAWPASLGRSFRRNGLVVVLVMLGAAIAFLAGLAVADGRALVAVHSGTGAFYALVPHGFMVSIFGLASLGVLIALAATLRQFWQGTGPPTAAPVSLRSVAKAVGDAVRLRYLGGGGVGCMNENERPGRRRAIFHHLTVWGFLSCFIATCIGTIYHYGFGREAPYPWWDLPVLFGTFGGVGLLAGTAGLLWAARRRDPAWRDQRSVGMDMGFSATLLLAALSGLLLLTFRSTSAMGALLAVHLAIVLTLFVMVPYGKFVHAIYRLAALVRYAGEQCAETE